MKGTSSNNPSLATEALIDLYDRLKGNADTATTIDFSKTSEETNTNGIYMTTDTDSGIPVYYYRGNVDNHLIFAKVCWRIIRTTETGGVKLIYDGKPSNGECNNTGGAASIGSYKFNLTANNETSAGYMYGSSIDDTANTTDSTIKTVIDTWYKNNMTSYTSQLEDTAFCNDRSYTTSGSNLYFGVYTRLRANRQPTLKCQNKKDKFTVNTSNGNGNLTYPVGLITADEMAYAGGVDSATNSSFYLYIGGYFWSLSPLNFFGTYTYDFCLSSSGSLVSPGISDAYGTRPVLALKSGTAVSGGSGTATDPFIVN